MKLAWKSMFSNLVFLLCFLKVHSAPWTLEQNFNKDIQNNDYVYNYGDGESVTSAGDEINEDEYHTYMEKKIVRIIQNGSIYLDGLRKSLQRYSEQMEDCAKKYNTINYTNPSEVAEFKRCETATADSERVRKVAQLALWTTRQIQNRELTSTYHEDDYSDKTLLLRLAWLLDRLAHMTGYEPKPEDFLNASPASTFNTFPPALVSLNRTLNITDDIKMKMINCLDKNNNSTQPAYERCPSESPMIEPMRKLFNITDTTTTQSTNQVELLLAPSEIEESENLKTILKRNSEVINREIEVNEKIRKKRQIDSEIGNQPLMKQPSEINESAKLRTILKRNSEVSNDKIEKFRKKRELNNEISNELQKILMEPGEIGAPVNLRTILKRNSEVSNEKIEKIRKKRELNNEISNGPRDLLMEFKKYFKTEPIVRELLNKNDISNYRKTKKIKRNANNEKNVVKNKELSRIPEDPYQDISKYVKFKEGTNVTINSIETARLRLSLEQTFQNPNIQTSRIYGANYNPLIPNVLVNGLFRSILDV